MFVCVCVFVGCVCLLVCFWLLWAGGPQKRGEVRNVEQPKSQDSVVLAELEDEHDVEFFLTWSQIYHSGVAPDAEPETPREPSKRGFAAAGCVPAPWRRQNFLGLGFRVKGLGFRAQNRSLLGNLHWPPRNLDN